MHGKKATVFAVFLVVALVITCIPIVSDDVSADNATETYGSVKSFSWTQIEEISQELIGMSVEELLMELSKNKYGYELYLTEPHFEGRMVTKRDIQTMDDSHITNDHISGYVEFGSIMAVHGNLPEAGTYEKQEGEDSLDFLDRIFTDYASKDPRDIFLNIALHVYVDVDITTTVDVATGELTGNNIVGRLYIVEYEKSNFEMLVDEGDEEFDRLTISYNDFESSSNFYMSADMDVLYEGMKIINSVDWWSMKPKITTHVNSIGVSSDMANGLWNTISEAIGAEDFIKGSLPNLILNIISSSSRVVDLVETIKSLTGKSLHDIDFIADMNASNTVDEDGREYVELELLKKEGSVLIRFPKADFSFPINEILDLIPSRILSDEAKVAIITATVVIGWDLIEVHEMDAETQEKYDEVYEHTNSAIKYDEEYELQIPTLYIVLSIIGLIGCVAAIIFVRRRSA